MRQLALALVLAFLAILGPSCATSPSRGLSAQQERTPTPPEFIKDPDLFMAFRSNATHFWYWARTALPEILSAPGWQPLHRKGVVMGDPHILNFGDIYLTGQPPIISVNDLDDSGTGALIGDLTRFYASALVSKNGASRTELVTAYVRGLSVMTPENEPEFIRKVEALTDAEVKANLKAYVLKNITTDPTGIRFNLDTTKLTPIGRTSPEVQSLFQSMQAPMAAVLPGFRVLDTGYKTSASGGSRGKARFWLLVERTDKELRIFEFKELGDTSVAYFMEQPEVSARFDAARRTFWGEPADPQAQDFQYKFATNGAKSFWMRPRYKFLVEGEDAKPDVAKALMTFEAYVLGRIHANSATEDYKVLFREAQPEVEMVLGQLSQAYVDALIRANAGAAAIVR